jgi:hypothetical protein
METYVLPLALDNTFVQVPYASEEECEKHAWVETLKHRFTYPSSGICLPAEMVQPWESGFTLDLRRTHGSTVTALGFGRDAMNRIQNHREGGIASVYDRHEYAEENRRVVEAMAARIMALADGQPADTVIALAR